MEKQLWQIEDEYKKKKCEIELALPCTLKKVLDLGLNSTWLNGSQYFKDEDDGRYITDNGIYDYNDAKELLDQIVDFDSWDEDADGYTILKVIPFKE